MSSKIVFFSTGSPNNIRMYLNCKPGIRKPYKRFNDFHFGILKGEFSKNQDPSLSKRKEIAQQIGVHFERVTVGY